MTNVVSFLKWDSKFFVKKVGSINIDLCRESIADVFKLADKHGYELLYVYSSNPIQESVLGNFSLIDVGGHITYDKKIIGNSLASGVYSSNIILYTKCEPTTHLLELAFLSGHLSRFKIDPLLSSSSFKTLYETWIRKSIQDKNCTDVYIYEIDGCSAGLVSAEWSESHCTIGLLAVLPACQGQGIASSLLRHVEQACMMKGIDTIEVKTQLSNINAQMLYLKNSFCERTRSFLYHGHRVAAKRLS